MHLQHVVTPNAWTEQIAEQIADRVAMHHVRVMFTCDEVTIHAPVLPYAWERLHVQPGSTVLVTAEGGADISQATALADVVSYISNDLL